MVQSALGGVARELEVELRPDASLPERIAALVAQSPDWMKRTLNHGVRGDFAVVATHYEIDFETVACMGFVDTYDSGEIEEIMMRTRPPADQLAARFEEGALPRRGGS